MPKIIDNLQETIVEKSMQLIKEKGYDQTTVRTICKECGISVGTMYNYFKSKEALVTSILWDDWKETKAVVIEKCTATDDIWVSLETIYNAIIDFSEKYKYIFKSSSAQYEVSGQFEKRHAILRQQLSEIIDAQCKKQAKNYTEFLPTFLCEMLLCFSAERTDFSELKTVIKPIFN